MREAYQSRKENMLENKTQAREAAVAGTSTAGCVALCALSIMNVDESCAESNSHSC